MITSATFQWEDQINRYKHTFSNIDKLQPTLRRGALLEKPPVAQPPKTFPKFYGTRKFITVFSAALHWSINPINIISSYFSKIHLKIILHLRPGLSSGLFPSLSHQSPMCTPPLPMHATCPHHLIVFDLTF
jgi:hypothetical protein